MTDERGDGARAESGHNAQLVNYPVDTTARAIISKPQLRALDVLGSEMSNSRTCGQRGIGEESTHQLATLIKNELRMTAVILHSTTLVVMSSSGNVGSGGVNCEPGADIGFAVSEHLVAVRMAITLSRPRQGLKIASG